ncbi:kinase-like domain-containing protein [Mycena rebaudengoi]|nr:kinase-like domain-containing protein [Mycena rebaudengoi]
MTCGPEVEEHFWPLRYQIRHGKLHAYENAIRALIVHARKELHPSILSSLTSDLSRRAMPTLSLTSFLVESRAQRERLSQIKSGMPMADTRPLKEAIWEDNLMIMLVFYEILTSRADLEDIMRLRGDEAQFILDLMQDAIRTHIDFVHILGGGSPRMRGPRRVFLSNIQSRGLLRNVDRTFDARRLIVKFSEACDLLPDSLKIEGVENRSPDVVLGGTFGDIYTAQYRGTPVALKRLRFFQAETVETRRKFYRETLIWKNLDHDFILPFLGVDFSSFPGHLCMVSPWMNKGPIIRRDGGPEKSSIPTLVCSPYALEHIFTAYDFCFVIQMWEIAVGLQYLHSQGVIHADLRGANILVDDHNHVRLADFGLTGFAHGSSTPTNRGGSTRWMAPELLDPACCGLEDFQRTFATDIYSFACVCLELYTGQHPFSDIHSEGAVLLKVIREERPACPSTIPDWATQLISKCWSHIPASRPSTLVIIESIVKAVRKHPSHHPSRRTSREYPPDTLPPKRPNLTSFRTFG